MIYKRHRFLKATSKPGCDEPQYIQNCTPEPFCIKQIFVALKCSVEKSLIESVLSHYNKYVYACLHVCMFTYIRT